MTMMGTKSVPRPVRELQMLDSADRVFGRRGYAEASMNEIAAGAGISKAMLYSYFESKEQLYIVCVERNRARLFERAEEAIAAEADPATHLETFARVYFDHIEEWRDSGWWVLYGDASAAAVSEMRRRNAELIASLLNNAAATLDVMLDPQNLELLSYTLVGAGEQAARWWLEHPAVPKEYVVERFVRFCSLPIADAYAQAAGADAAATS